jgi:hypothetical protein
MTYDVILVLGVGIREDGSLPDSAKAFVEKAVELWKQSVAPRVIFSGRWSYTLKFTPPATEAEAMAAYAQTLGLPKTAIHIENEPITTVTNLCLVKKHYLEPHNYRRILLVTIEILSERTLFNATMVFGLDYTIDVTYADFSYAADQQALLIEQEKLKLAQAKQFHSRNQAGDHQAIYKAAMDDLEQNYLPKRED